VALQIKIQKVILEFMEDELPYFIEFVTLVSNVLGCPRSSFPAAIVISVK
jgi:hypothetical protein